MPHKSVDKFFPIRFWVLFLLTLASCILLLFWTDAVVLRMTSEPAEMLRMGRFLYFRGWFLLIVLVLGLYSYLKNWYPAIVFGSLFLTGCMNFVSDLFNVYAEVIAHPSPRITVMMLVRLLALWFIYLTVKNSSRLPDVGDRINIMLLFKRNV